MKPIVTAFACALLCLAFNAEARRPRRHHGRAARPVVTSSLAARRDEVQLSPNLLRRLQLTLIQGGYLAGTADGRLSPRTRRALRAFQRDYHLTGTGSLDLPTANALLGSEVLNDFLVANAR